MFNMRMSRTYIPTLREAPSEAEIPSHKLMLRAGLMRKLASGVYSYLPIAMRVLHKIESIVREEMNSQGGLEVLMSALQPSQIWQKSGRWNDFGPEMFKLKDRGDREFCLGPTHEELFTDLITDEVSSYKQLPLLLYQIQTKYRDEIRPRFGIMRAREFIMKDLYSFDSTLEGLDESYKKMYDAYCEVFKRCGLEYYVVEADTGAMGGSDSHEFIIPSDIGEDEMALCNGCGYAANVERCECPQPEDENVKDELEEFNTVQTPGIKTIDDLGKFFNVDANKMIKTLIYKGDSQVWAVLVRGDCDINEAKLRKALSVTDLELADDDTILEVTGAPTGFAGPVGLDNIMIIADYSIKNVVNGITGANKKDQHLTGVNPGRDFNVKRYEDLRIVKDGELCPKCGQPLVVRRGIEVGHIFKLGTKYTQSLGATFLDEKGVEKPIIMGSYGIGITRTLGAIIETNHDDKGITWPLAVAPYHVIIVSVNCNDQESSAFCEKVYDDLKSAGIEVIMDDRKERPGVKFNDADLIGVPIRVTIGPRGIKKDSVEIKLRKTGKESMVHVSQVVNNVEEMVKEELT